jgi:hypothetical protein
MAHGPRWSVTRATIRLYNQTGTQFLRALMYMMSGSEESISSRGLAVPLHPLSHAHENLMNLKGHALPYPRLITLERHFFARVEL